MKGYQYQSEFAKKHVAEGEPRACREILIRLLEQRFGAVPEPLRQCIAEETETDRLYGWLSQVLSIGSPEELDA